MQPYVNQIFYPVNKFDALNVDNLKKYMLSDDFIKSCMITNIHEKEKKVEEKKETVIKMETKEREIEKKVEMNTTNASTVTTPTQHTTQKIYYPKSQNSLFWAVFIGHYGFDEYNMVRNKTTREMEENHKIVDYFKTSENKTKLKQTNMKITNAVLQELMADVMTNNGNVVHKALVYSVYYDIPIYILKETNNTYLKYIPNEIETEKEPIIIYYSISNRSYGVNVSCDNIKTQTTLADIHNNSICLESHNKPLKGISSYKVCDLDEMAQKLNIEKHLKKSKSELYQFIYDYMVW